MMEVMGVLLKLQETDLDLKEIKAEHDAIPGKIEALDSDVNSLKQSLQEKEEALKTLKVEIRDAESKVARLDEITKKYKQQLLNVKTNREYSALLTEIEGVKREKEEFEERIIQKMENSETLKNEIGQIKEALLQSEKESAAGQNELTSRMKQLQEQIEIKIEKRKNLAVRLDKTNLRLYERIMGSRMNQAVVPLHNGSCGGCFDMVPLQKVNDIVRAERIYTCDSCGRILYHEDNLK